MLYLQNTCSFYNHIFYMYMHLYCCRNQLTCTSHLILKGKNKRSEENVIK